MNSPIKKNEINSSNYKNNISKNLSVNRDVIANCLGIQPSKLNRKERVEKLNSVSFSNINKNNSNKSSEKLNNKIDISTRKDFEIGIANKSTRNFSKPSENINNCFVIFNKSNIKNLKKEIQRYDSKQNTIDKDLVNNSFEENNDKNFTNNKNLFIQQFNIIPSSHRNIIKGSNDDILRSPVKNKIINNNNFETSRMNNLNNMSPKNNDNFSMSENNEQVNKKISKYIISLGDSKSKIEKGKNFIFIILDDMILREWLESIGYKRNFMLDFTKDELSEFKDG